MEARESGGKYCRRQKGGKSGVTSSHHNYESDLTAVSGGMTGMVNL
jgi:hypothetical protein